MWKESCPQCATRSHASSSNKFFPRFYDLMLGLHLFSCRGVRSEQFVKGKNSPSSRHVCIWSSASTMTLWKSLRRDEVIGHLAVQRRGTHTVANSKERWLWATFPSWLPLCEGERGACPAVQVGCWSRDAGDISKATKSRAVLSLCPGRWWQWTEAEEWQWQPGRVHRNPLSEPWWRITCQSSYPRTPTLYPLLFHSPGPLIPIWFSHLSSSSTFFPHFFIPKSHFLPLTSLPSTGPSAHPQHFSSCPSPPSPPTSQPLVSANILCLPTEANRIHSYTHISGSEETWMWAAVTKNLVEKGLGTEKEDKCKKKVGIW